MPAEPQDIISDAIVGVDDEVGLEKLGLAHPEPGRETCEVGLVEFSRRSPAAESGSAALSLPLITGRRRSLFDHLESVPVLAA
jgi:hypothetical protein